MYTRIKRFSKSMVLNYFNFFLKSYFFFSMYEKIISHLDIDEIGTNFPRVDFILNFIFIYLLIYYIFRNYTIHIGGVKNRIMKN